MNKYIILEGTYHELGTATTVSASDTQPNGQPVVFESRYDLEALFPNRFKSVPDQPVSTPEVKVDEEPAAIVEEPQDAPEEPVVDLGTVVFAEDGVEIRERKGWFRVFLDGEQYGAATRDEESATRSASDILEAME